MFHGEKPISGSATMTTNNQMEMMAVFQALEHCLAHRELHIITDSKMVIGWLAKRWKCKSQVIADILQSCRITMQAKDITLSFTLVKGHGNNAGNIAVDKAASAQAKATRAL